MPGGASPKKIVIVDYGLGNLLSVARAFLEFSRESEVLVTGDPTALKGASHIVLPGVGNFRAGMENLTRTGLVQSLEEEVLGKEKPFLGICLGMQLLVKVGEEFGEHEGLGWIPGRVRQLDSGKLPLPHIGWQDIEVVKESLLFPGGLAGKDYYFVHSFALECPEEYVTAFCTYGRRFPAAIHVNNIVATQFHPEKSRKAGLEILQNFVRGKECSKSVWFLSSS
jgi:imidazole glycerol-phosphate synthase subunit HisH